MHHLDRSQAPPVCAACLHRFKERETRKGRREDELTSFPCFLEERGALRERHRRGENRNEDVGAYRGLRGLFGATWGPGKAGDGASQGSGSVDEREWRRDASTFDGGVGSMRSFG
tara:strand:- start:1133 stop:1477 length:345 start_codon:yes stop_codon:yes gene_type:complete